MRISAAVQHHPSRRDLLEPLLRGLSGLSTEIIEDPEPGSRVRSAWRTYRCALERTPADATHRLIVQDDALLCRDFATVVERAVTARPDRMLVLCVCGFPITASRAILIADSHGWSWAKLNTIQCIPAIAVVWPARLISPVISHVDAQNWPLSFCADDEIIGRSVRALNETVLATVPSLVDHPDMVESIARKKASYGTDPMRMATCFVPDCCDPLTVDWTRGPT